MKLTEKPTTDQPLPINKFYSELQELMVRLMG